VTSFVCLRTPILGEGEVVEAMTPYEKAMVVSHRLSIVSTVLSLTIQHQFAIECLQSSNQQGWVTLGRNLGRKGLTDVSQWRRDMGQQRSCQYLLPFERNARTLQTDRQTCRPRNGRPNMCRISAISLNKKAVLPQGNRAMPQVFFSVEVRQQHSLQV